MQQHGTIPTPEQLDRVLELYSNRGETTEVVRLISDFENGELSSFHANLSWSRHH